MKRDYVFSVLDQSLKDSVDALEILKEEPMTGRCLTKKNYCLQATLSRLLREHNITPAQLSEATGVPKNTLRDWAYGKGDGRIHRIENAEDGDLVAQYFGIDFNELQFGTSADKLAQAEINRLNAEILKYQMDDAVNQLTLNDFIKRVQDQESELKSLREKLTG